MTLTNLQLIAELNKIRKSFDEKKRSQLNGREPTKEIYKKMKKVANGY